MTTIISSLTQSHTSYRARDGTDAQVWGRGRTQMILSRGPDNISTQPQRVDDSQQNVKERKKERKKQASSLARSNAAAASSSSDADAGELNDACMLRWVWVGTYMLGWGGGCGWANSGMDLCSVSWDCSRGMVCVWAPRGPACSLVLGPRRGRHSHALAFCHQGEISVDSVIYIVRRFGELWELLSHRPSLEGLDQWAQESWSKLVAIRGLH